MTTIYDFRRENLRKLIANNGGPLALATKLGYTNSSFLVQMTGPAPIRDVTDRTARSFETKLGLEPLSLDKAVDMTAVEIVSPAANRRRIYSAQHAPETMGNAGLGKLIQFIGETCESESITLPQKKFADILALAVTYPPSHDNSPREDFIRQLVRLAK